MKSEFICIKPGTVSVLIFHIIINLQLLLWFYNLGDKNTHNYSSVDILPMSTSDNEWNR
jgi:hypothetical protein